MLDLTGAGHAAVAEWQAVNARVLAAALAALPASTRRGLNSTLPALRELTGAVDAVADDVQPDARQMADETASRTA